MENAIINNALYIAFVNANIACLHSSVEERMLNSLQTWIPVTHAVGRSKLPEDITFCLSGPFWSSVSTFFCLGKHTISICWATDTLDAGCLAGALLNH